MCAPTLPRELNLIVQFTVLLNGYYEEVPSVETTVVEGGAHFVVVVAQTKKPESTHEFGAGNG
jgi:hypothetical protein